MNDNIKNILQMVDLNDYYTNKSNYFDIYEIIFHDIKNTVKNILNVSHSNNNIYSLDSYLFYNYFNNPYIINITASSKELAHDLVKNQNGIVIIQNCNSFNQIIIDTFLNNNLHFDLIVCDGKNTSDQICKEVINYSKTLLSRGMLIVENINDENLDIVIQETSDELKKYIKIKKIDDNNNIFIIDKTENIYTIQFINLFEYICNKFNIVCYSKNINLYDVNIPLVISYENEILENKNAQLFKKTLENNNWEFLFICNGIKWQGFINKINFYHYITKYILKEKIIILSDSRDVLCCRRPNSFMNKIKNILEMNKLIISAELFLLGRLDWSEDEIKEKTKDNPDFFWQGIPINNYWEKNMIYPDRKYVNSGLIIGKSCRVNKLFNWLKINNFTDDQLGISIYVNNFMDDVYLDHNAEILHTSTSLVNAGCSNGEIQRKDSPSISELLGYSSYFLHIPGANISKGQKHLYNICSNIIHNYHSETILNEYSLSQNDNYILKYLFT